MTSTNLTINARATTLGDASGAIRGDNILIIGPSTMTNPWDRPKSQKYKSGDPNVDMLHLAVGRALTNWESVEENFALLFAAFTGMPTSWHYNPAARAFGAVESARGRATMLDEAAKAFFIHYEWQAIEDTEEIISDLDKLVKEYQGWGGRRNDIAHGKTTQYQLFDPHETCLLVPGHYNSRKRPMNWHPAYEYTAAEIDKYRSEFAALSGRAAALIERVRRWKTNQRKQSRRSGPQRPAK